MEKTSALTLPNELVEFLLKLSVLFEDFFRSWLLIIFNLIK